MGSADEWNQALKECLAHAAHGPILIPRCRVILGLDTPNADEPDGGDGEDSAPASAEDLTPQQIVDYARTQETITGAGLGWQPRDNALVGLPMLVHASTPTQTLTLSVLGQQVVVEVEAADFSYDFGDNTAPLKTTDPSAPYPVKTLNHVYTSVSEGTVITLQTTWNAHITYPSGRTSYLANALTTTETSTPITIRKATITLTTLDE